MTGQFPQYPGGGAPQGAQPVYGQMPQQPMPQGYGQISGNPERNGLGLAALILGIVGLLFCLVPLTGFIGLILGVIGLALGLAGLSRVRKAQASNKGVTISGIVLSALAVVGGIAGIVIVFTAVDQLGDDLKQISNDWDSYSECISNADTPEEMNACN
ncbi:DUF4190 domain-containing protein [Rhodococcus hoagii]|nr:DUF4190 domain-containing protein [Prescottella equi]